MGEPDLDAARGDQLGGWQLTERLYRSSGMQLWRATAEPDRVAGIKLGTIAPLRREGSVLTGVSDAAVPACTVHIDGERPHLQLDLPAGMVLQARIRRRAMTVPEALEVAMELAGVLARLHAKGVFRPALRPSSVLLRPADGLMLLDWSTGWRAGQAVTDDEPPVAQDVAALGMLLYAILTAARAIPGDAGLDLGDGYSDVLRDLVRRMTGPVAERPGTLREVSYTLRGMLTDPSALIAPPAPPLEFTSKGDMGRGPAPKPITTPPTSPPMRIPARMVAAGAAAAAVVVVAVLLLAWSAL